jgi:hypothetical protein
MTQVEADKNYDIRYSNLPFGHYFQTEYYFYAKRYVSKGQHHPARQIMRHELKVVTTAPVSLAVSEPAPELIPAIPVSQPHLITAHTSKPPETVSADSYSCIRDLFCHSCN